jgi:hypothetical protein
VKRFPLRLAFLVPVEPNRDVLREECLIQLPPARAARHR